MLVFKDGAMISNAFVPTFIALTKLTRIGISSLLFACTIVKTQDVDFKGNSSLLSSCDCTRCLTSENLMLLLPKVPMSGDINDIDGKIKTKYKIRIYLEE